ncbi:MAG TPA: type III secretion inner membrane ring lipoprotein SctJ [Parachlamydiaceae bacterium]|nr:type III secretion inner membrane ring lipoprotein SctJ [Parachlamydiaceae bacterium]
MNTNASTLSIVHFLKKLRKFSLFCFMLLFLASCDSEKTIVNGLDEREANEILVFLASKGIQAEKAQSKDASGGGGGGKVAVFDITVSEDMANQAMALLNQNGLPRRRSQNLLGIFSNVGLVPSAMEQQIRYQAGLAEQAASTIRKIDGILDAEVQISFPKEDPLNPDKKTGKITASVYVKHNGVLDDPNSHLITKIKRFVEASVTGLSFDNITVIPDRARFNELPSLNLGNAEEKSFVNVWGLIIGKESLFSFRLLFFSFLILLLFLLLSLLWLGWKIYPILKSHGGIKELFHLEPLGIKKAEEEPKKEEEKALEEEKDKKTETRTVDKDFDETE